MTTSWPIYEDEQVNLPTTQQNHGPLSNMILCSPNEKQGKENLGQKRLSDDTKVEFGATKDHC